MVVEDDVLDADATARLLRFRAAPGGERSATLRLVTRVPVRDRHESDTMAQRRILGSNAARALVTVVRVGAERNDIELAVSARRLSALRLCLQVVRGAHADPQPLWPGQHSQQQTDKDPATPHRTSVRAP